MAKPKKVKAEKIEPGNIKLKPDEFGILFDLIKEGKSLQDVARALIPPQYSIVSTDTYDALIDEHNNLQQKYHDSQTELEGLKPMYEDYKFEATLRGDEVKILRDASDIHIKKINDLEAELEEANQRIASQTNELLKIVQAEEDKPAPSVPVVSVKVEHKLSDNTTITLGHSEPLGDRSMTTAHEEVYLKVLSSLDNLTELSK